MGDTRKIPLPAIHFEVLVEKFDRVGLIAPGQFS